MTVWVGIYGVPPLIIRSFRWVKQCLITNWEWRCKEGTTVYHSACSLNDWSCTEILLKAVLHWVSIKISNVLSVLVLCSGKKLTAEWLKSSCPSHCSHPCLLLWKVFSFIVDFQFDINLQQKELIKIISREELLLSQCNVLLLWERTSTEV